MGGRKDLFGFGTSFESKHWLSLDICGCFGICVSWGIHIYALYVLYYYVINAKESLIQLLIFMLCYVPFSILAMVSLYQASTTNPGAVPMGARPFTIVQRAASGELRLSNNNNTNNDSNSNINNNNATTNRQQQRAIRRCHKCNNNYKPNRAHHDSVTGRCIVKFDHFCPWVNNAIGALNHKFFCLFLLYTALSCTVCLILLLMRLIQCGYVQDEDASGNHHDRLLMEYRYTNSNTDNNDNNMNHYVYPHCYDFLQVHKKQVSLLAIAAIIFLLFTVTMGCEQIEAIQTNQSKIARMKQSVGQAGTELSRITTEFNEMFGGNTPNVAWHWYVPIQPAFPRGMKTVLLGYEYDHENDNNQQPYQEPSSNVVDIETGGLLSSNNTTTSILNDNSSTSSVKNRSRTGSANSTTANNNDIANTTDDINSNGLEDGITLVERTKTRLT